MFEGPVSIKTENESVATSYTSERKDYSKSEGRRLLAHISNSSNTTIDAGPTSVTDRSQRIAAESLTKQALIISSKRVGKRSRKQQFPRWSKEAKSSAQALIQRIKRT